jgi:K+-sensing histidine kinase KdpD
MNSSNVSAIDLKTLLALNIHEIKNLMALLMLRLDAIKSENIDVSDSRLLCHRVNDCMERMLLLFNLQTERLSPSIEAHSPGDFIEEFVQNAIVLAAGKITIDMDVEQAPAYWFFDRDLVEMAMLNAMHNALRYAEKRIVIRATLDNDALLLSVEDDGNGFPQVILENPIGTLSEQHTDGMGLGLFLAEIIAKAHVNKARQGKLLLHNKDAGHGGVFALQLP